MKATGIVRRIDDLGRIVIPREIRSTLHIREGDPMEIYTTREGEVVFKKYSHMGNCKNYFFAAQRALHSMDVDCVIYDTDRCVCHNWQFPDFNVDDLRDGKPINGFFCKPVVVDGEYYGAIVYDRYENTDKISLVCQTIVNLIASYNL